MRQITTTLSLFILAFFIARDSPGQQILPVCGVSDAGESQMQMGSSSSGAPIRFPNHGTINALVIFVQYEDDDDPAIGGSWMDDPETEWPIDRSKGPDRKLPAWAENEGFIATPGTTPTST